MAVINSTMKPFTNIILSSLKRLYIFKMFYACASPGWGAVNNHMRSCKSPGEPVRQVREPSEGFELRLSFYMQETVK